MAKAPSSRALIAAIRKLLPKPVRKVDEADGGVVLIAGDPGEVIVRVSDSSLLVYEFAVEWVGPHEPEVREIPIAQIEWPQLPRTAAIDAATAIVRATQESRREKFRTCRFCGENNPPEWMQEKGVCDSCAESRLGIVH